MTIFRGGCPYTLLLLKPFGLRATGIEKADMAVASKGVG